MRMLKRGVLYGLLALLLVLGLSSCNFMYGIFDPLIGTWEYSSSGSTVDYTFNWDNTLGIAVTQGSTTVNATGTFIQDSAASTVSLSYTLGGTAYSWSCGYSVSGNTLTLSQSGSSISLTRK
jgi:hypothetical protein